MWIRQSIGPVRIPPIRGAGPLHRRGRHLHTFFPPTSGEADDGVNPVRTRPVASSQGRIRFCRRCFIFTSTIAKTVGGSAKFTTVEGTQHRRLDVDGRSPAPGQQDRICVIIARLESAPHDP